MNRFERRHPVRKLSTVKTQFFADLEASQGSQGYFQVTPSSDVVVQMHIEPATAKSVTISGVSTLSGYKGTVITLPVVSREMTASVRLATVLAALKQEGALLDFVLGKTRGETIYAYGQVPREELSAYLLVRQKVREAMAGQGWKVDLSLDTDAINQ